MNRMAVAGVAALMVLASSAQVLASMSISSQQPVEPGCPTMASAAGTERKDSSDSSTGMPGLASAAATVLPDTAIAATPSAAATATVPSDTPTATIPSGVSAATTGAARAISATSATAVPSERRRAEQTERWDDLTQRFGDLARRKAPQLQRAVEESAGSRKRGLERIARFLDIAQKMKPGALARYR
jgi:hypothetical protein